MQVKQKLCGAWRKHGHVLMSCSRGFFVTGAGFVIRRIPAVVVRAVKPLAYRRPWGTVKFWADYPAPKNAIALGSSVRCHDSFWFISVGHDFHVHYSVKPVSHAHLLRAA